MNVVFFTSYNTILQQFQRLNIVQRFMILFSKMKWFGDYRRHKSSKVIITHFKVNFKFIGYF